MGRIDTILRECKGRVRRWRCDVCVESIVRCQSLSAGKVVRAETRGHSPVVGTDRSEEKEGKGREAGGCATEAGYMYPSWGALEHSEAAQPGWRRCVHPMPMRAIQSDEVLAKAPCQGHEHWSRGTKKQGSRGAEEQKSRRAQKQKSKGAEGQAGGRSDKQPLTVPPHTRFSPRPVPPGLRHYPPYPGRGAGQERPDERVLSARPQAASLFFHLVSARTAPSGRLLHCSGAATLRPRARAWPRPADDAA